MQSLSVLRHVHLRPGLLTPCLHRTYFQVMWKYKEQVSFPLSEAEYMAQLNAVAELITQWGLVSTVRDGINRSSPRGPGYTGGGGARAVSPDLLPLQL